MNTYHGLWEAIDTAPAEELSGLPDRGEFRLCGIAGNLVKKYAKKDNRPWVAFTLATRALDHRAQHVRGRLRGLRVRPGRERAVLVQGNIIRGADGPRVNVKECYPLDAAVARTVRKVTWLLRPGAPGLGEFLHGLREAVVRDPGDTRIEFADPPGRGRGPGRRGERRAFVAALPRRPSRSCARTLRSPGSGSRRGPSS